MDTTELQAKIDALKAQETNDEAAVANDISALAQAEAELAQAGLINSLVALTADEITAINAGLAADGSKISLVVAP